MPDRQAAAPDPTPEQVAYEQYPQLLDTLVMFVRPLLLLPLSEMAAANERMQTIAPFFVAPLAYHAGARNLEEQRRLIDAAAALQRVMRSLAPKGGESDG